MNDFLDWFDGAKLGIVATAAVAALGYRHQAREAGKGRQHDRELEDTRYGRQLRQERRDEFAALLGAATTLYACWRLLALTPPRSEEEHETEYLRREPHAERFDQQLAKARINADPSLGEPLDALDEAIRKAQTVGLTCADSGVALRWDAWRERAGLGFSQARVSLVEAVRAAYPLDA